MQTAIGIAATTRAAITGRGRRRTRMASGSSAAWLRGSETAAWPSGTAQVRTAHREQQAVASIAPSERGAHEHGGQGCGDEGRLERGHVREVDGKTVDEPFQGVTRRRDRVQQVVPVLLLDEEVRVPVAGLELLVEGEGQRTEQGDAAGGRSPSAPRLRCRTGRSRTRRPRSRLPPRYRPRRGAPDAGERAAWLRSQPAGDRLDSPQLGLLVDAARERARCDRLCRPPRVAAP